MEKPTFKQNVDNFCKFVYNSEDGTVFGRGGRSWLELGFFYLIYYICLAAFFIGTISVFYQTVDWDHPKLQGEDSLLKGNPGMGFSPLPDIDTTLIRVSDEQKKIDSYVNTLTTVLKPYKKAWEKANSTVQAACKLANNKEIRAGEEGKTACPVDYETLTEQCNEKNSYGFTDGQPCILLKLNRIYGWTPQPYKPDDTNIPEEIKDAITADSGMIQIKCMGENPADVDSIGNVTYYPQQGFPLLYFPYKKQEGYLSPLVFAKFVNTSKYLALMIECKAYAQNIAVDVQEKQGSVHFEMLIDRI